MSITRVLSIAGSDSSGGAGIQADIRTITMLGGHPMTAITAVTAQDTTGVTGVLTVPPEMVLKQVDAAIGDIGVDAIKIGMIGSPEIVDAILPRLDRDTVPVVFDPVMVSTSGAKLADDATIAAFGRIMDRATIVTPNMPELSALSDDEDPVAAALRLVSDHGCAVMIKGGHGEEDGDALVDALIEEDNMTSWQGSRIETRHTHGTGCTLSSAIATFLGAGYDLASAVDRARVFTRIAIHGAPGLGKGSGPLGHANVRLDIPRRMQINQVTVCMDDYAKAVEFYSQLGLKQIVENPPDYARFETAGGMTLSVFRDEQFRTPGGTTVYFECPNLLRETERLSRLGLQFEHGPIEQPWMWLEARLRDPFGNMVCLYEARENRRYPPWRMEDQS